MIRPATLEDAPMIARVHVQAWVETYPGMLPASEIARRTYELRLVQWTAILEQGKSRIYVLPDLGFAQVGPQRSPGWTDLGHSEELYALYLLRSAHRQGHGRALLQAARSDAGFTATVLAANARAVGFYEAAGGQLLTTTEETIENMVIRDRIYGWAAR